MGKGKLDAMESGVRTREKKQVGPGKASINEQLGRATKDGSEQIKRVSLILAKGPWEGRRGYNSTYGE